MTETHVAPPQPAPPSTAPPRPASPQAAPPRIERALEGTLFAARWLLAPFYLGMILALVFLLYDFVMRVARMARHIRDAGHDEVIVGILSMIDLSLMANLVLMVMFAGYENFVSRLHIDDHPDRLDWMGSVGFGDLKLKLMTSIVAISAIRLLESFMDIESLTNHELAWTVGIHLTFVVSGLLLAYMEKLMHK
jgi:uncharacterized protein (TIGR00645 family)